MLDLLIWFVFLCIDLIAVYTIFLLVEVPFGIPMKVNRPLLFLLSILFLGVQAVSEKIFRNQDFWCLFIEFGMLILIILLFATKKKLWGIILLVPASLIYLEWGVLFQLFEMLLGIHDKVLFSYGEIHVRPLYFLEEISLFVLLLLLKRYAHKKAMCVSLTVPEGILITVFGFFSPILLEVMVYIDRNVQQKAISMGFLIFAIILNLAILYTIAYRKRAAYYKGLSKHYREQFDAEFAYFQEYKKQNMDMSHFRHDWNNHVNIMQRMFAEGKYEDARDYFASLPGVSEHKSGKVLSGNEAVDMVLALKMPVLEEKEIDFVLEGTLNGLSYMSVVDICTMFFNLIDNAVEAASKCESDRFLRIKAKQNANLIFISFENSMTGELKKEGDIVCSTKNADGEHGIGLQNVADIVARYHGEQEIEAGSGVFKIRFMFPLEEK